MSRITTAVLCFGNIEDEVARIAELNRAMVGTDATVNERAFVLHEHVPDFGRPIAVAVLNHCTRDEIAAAVVTVAWEWPAGVRLFVHNEEDEGMSPVPLPFPRERLAREECP